MSNDKWKMVLSRLNSPATSFWRRHRCGGRILAVVLADERFRDDDAVSRKENSLHLAAVENHGDTAGLGKRLQSFAHVFLQRTKQLLTTFLVKCLTVFGFARGLLLKLIQLIDFGLNCLRCDRSPLRGLLLQVGYLVRELLYLRRHIVKFLLPIGELANQLILGCVESRDARFRILKFFRKDDRDLANRDSHRRGLAGRRLRLWLGAGSLRESRGQSNRHESECDHKTTSVHD